MSEEESNGTRGALIDYIEQRLGARLKNAEKMTIQNLSQLALRIKGIDPRAKDRPSS